MYAIFEKQLPRVPAKLIMFITFALLYTKKNIE